MIEATVYVDGGCSRNGQPDARAYGSFAVYQGDVKKRHESFEFPDIKSSGAAEYAALLQVLLYIDGKEKENKNKVDWTILTDSELVIGHVLHNYKVKAEHLRSSVTFARNFVIEHNNVHLEWISGDEMKKILGH